MAKTSAGRMIFAVIASYLAFGVMVTTTEQLLSSLSQGRGHTFALSYFVIDLISQSIYTVVAGYLCHAVARSPQSIALVGLIGIGLFVGTFSLVTSWKTEPHWYGIGLLLSYAPCVWIGWALMTRRGVESPPNS